MPTRQRPDGRRYNQIRELKITRNYLKNPEGSVLIELGQTWVVCSVTVEDRVPHFLLGSKSGWITAEYGMLPRSTESRKIRDAIRGRQDGRTMEIQRMIGRSLRTAIDLRALGERTLWVDCDVIQADGGTRTASITGAFVALIDALNFLRDQEIIETLPVLNLVAAISVGIIEKNPILDLSYNEDSMAEADMNLVFTNSADIIEIQGTGEKRAFSWEEMKLLHDLAWQGVKKIFKIQKGILKNELSFAKSR